MAGSNVRFFFGSLAKYKALAVKEPMALYFVTDEETGKVYLYKGDKLFASDALASTIADGWMSKEDKIALDKLVESSADPIVMQPVDGTISIVDNKIGVRISEEHGNLIAVKDDGLFVNVDPVTIESVTGLSDRLVAIEKSVIGGIRYKGSVPTVSDLPVDAVQGDLYEVLEDNSEWCFNGEAWFEYGRISNFMPVAGSGIEFVDNTISVNIATESNGLVAVNGALFIALATKDAAGALSPVDKAFIDAIPNTYATIERVQKTCEQIKYEISHKPAGTLVNYGEKEIRVMCPADTKWVKQNVGATGNSNYYYMGFKAYAPEGAVSFKEGDRGVIVDEMFDFNGDFAGVDEFGRKYSIVWLALASYDADSDTWSYFGDNSSADKYVGWDYVVEWFNEEGLKIASDAIRINLSNENCHNVTEPYYIAALEEKIANVGEAYMWGEI